MAVKKKIIMRKERLLSFDQQGQPAIFFHHICLHVKKKEDFFKLGLKVKEFLQLR